MTVNKTNKTKKTAKTGEALTTVGVRLSKQTVKALEEQSIQHGRSLSCHLRAILTMKAGSNSDTVWVGIDANVASAFSDEIGNTCLSVSVQQLMAKEVRRSESARKLAEHRKKIAEFVIEEVG